MSENDKDSKKLQEQKPVDGGEMKKSEAKKGAKDNKKDPKAPKEEELVRSKLLKFLSVSILVRGRPSVKREIRTSQRETERCRASSTGLCLR